MWTNTCLVPTLAVYSGTLQKGQAGDERAGVETWTCDEGWGQGGRRDEEAMREMNKMPYDCNRPPARREGG